MNAARETIGYAPARWNRAGLVAWLPLAVLTPGALVFGYNLSPWILMWLNAFALYFGTKWLTWWQNRKIPASPGRHLGYLFAWPGMDAKAFLAPAKNIARPRLWEWVVTILKIALGAALLWGVARQIPSAPLLQGWVGLLGLILVLHFGSLHLMALAWQYFGVDAQPLMRAPIVSRSLTEFWGARWNSAFNKLVHDWTFRPLYRVVGTVGATTAVFLLSGFVHELVISVPARGGYGLPTIYFLIQGAGLLFERTAFARKCGLGRNVRGWMFTVLITASPVVFLFHAPFITRVVLPFLHVLNAI